MDREPIQTSAAPQAIGTYSQAVRAGNTVYLSGQIGLVPGTMQLAEGIDAQIEQIFRNLVAVAAAVVMFVIWQLQRRDVARLAAELEQARRLVIGLD